MVAAVGFPYLGKPKHAVSIAFPFAAHNYTNQKNKSNALISLL